MQLTVQLPVQLACSPVQLAWRPPSYNPPWGGTPRTGLHALRAHHPLQGNGVLDAARAPARLGRVLTLTAHSGSAAPCHLFRSSARAALTWGMWRVTRCHACCGVPRMATPSCFGKPTRQSRRSISRTVATTTHGLQADTSTIATMRPRRRRRTSNALSESNACASVCLCREWLRLI